MTTDLTDYNYEIAPKNNVAVLTNIDSPLFWKSYASPLHPIGSCLIADCIDCFQLLSENHPEYKEMQFDTFKDIVSHLNKKDLRNFRKRLFGCYHSHITSCLNAIANHFNRDLANDIDTFDLSTIYNEIYQKELTEISEIVAEFTDTFVERKVVSPFRVGGKFQLPISNAFSKPFHDLNGIQEKFLDFTFSCLADFTHSAHLPPFSSIVQSSGSGKSRLLVNIGETTTPVIYICLRNPEIDSSGIGYPPRSKIANFMLKPIASSEYVRESYSVIFIAQYLAFMAACMIQIHRHFSSVEGRTASDFEIGCKSFMGRQLSVTFSSGKMVGGEVFWDETFLLIHQIWNGVLNYFIKNISPLPEKPLSPAYKSAKFVSLFEEQLILHWNSVRSLLLEFGFSQNSRQHRPILFAFDEAQSLQKTDIDMEKDYFTYLTYALHRSPQKELNGIFAYFVGIQSQAVTIKPPFIPDPSLRYIRESDRILFHPFNLIDFRNNMASNVTESNVHLVCSNLGRPLWKSLETNFKNKILVAQLKLLGGFPLKELPHDYVTPAKIALISCRAAPYFISTNESIETLVEKHCALCYHIDMNTRRAKIGYSSEPILAEASANLVARSKREDFQYFSRVSLVETMASLVENGIVDAGYRGELVSKILLLYGWDEACILSNPTEPIFTRWMSVRDYLLCTFGPAMLVEIEKSRAGKTNIEKFMSAKVCFYHFTFLNGTPKRQHMEIFFNRACAIHCKRSQTGADLIIPVRFDGENAEYSYIIVSCKNHSTFNQNAFTLASVVSSSENVDIDQNPDYPYMILLMETGDSLEPTIKSLLTETPQNTRLSSKTEYRICVGTVGIHESVFQFLKNDSVLKESMRRLSKACDEPIAKLDTERDKRIIASMSYPTFVLNYENTQDEIN